MMENSSKDEVERRGTTVTQKSEGSASCMVDLCHKKLEFVQINAEARLSSACFEVCDTSYVQCDYAFGGEFTSYHNFTLDPVNTEKFYQSLSESQDLLINAKCVKEKFNGPQWLTQLENYCQERSIKFIYTYRSVE